MEAERIRYSVIARLAGFDELQRPLQIAAKKQRFLSDNYRSKAAMIGTRVEKCSTEKDQAKMRVTASLSESHKREEDSRGFISTVDKKSSSGFVVTPTKEMCRAYLQKPNSSASKHVIDARAAPPHRWGVNFTGSHVNGEMANHRNLRPNLKAKHHNRVKLIKPRTMKKENSPRRFSPVSDPRSFRLDDTKTGQTLLLENKVKERKKFPESTIRSGEKDKFSRKVASNSMVSASMDLGSSLRQIGSETLAEEDENVNALYCCGRDLECQTSLEESSQPSPVSVLEPICDMEILQNIESLRRLDFLGLKQQLQILKSESIETDSEGSGLVVSSDEESDEDSFLDSETKEYKEIEPIRSFGVREGRDSSYADNILAEAGLENVKRVFNEWDSVDLPINPKIFEKLEKKYAKQTSWRRSERRLLFDRINSGLVEILESYVAAPRWKKPISRRLGTVLSTQGLKEELQKLLALQENRAKKESSAKIQTTIDDDEWLELEADVEAVVQEIETMLVDELLSDLVHSL